MTLEIFLNFAYLTVFLTRRMKLAIVEFFPGKDDKTDGEEGKGMEKIMKKKLRYGDSITPFFFF